MTNVFRTMIVEAAVAPLAREIAAALSAELGAPRNVAYRLAHE
jgi:hypothetical protein